MTRAAGTFSRVYVEVYWSDILCRVKTTRKIRTVVTKERVSKEEAERRNWPKFGAEKGKVRSYHGIIHRSATDRISPAAQVWTPPPSAKISSSNPQEIGRHKPKNLNKASPKSDL